MNLLFPMHLPKAHHQSPWTAAGTLPNSSLQSYPTTSTAPQDLSPHPASGRGVPPQPPPPTAGRAGQPQRRPWIRTGLWTWPSPEDLNWRKWRKCSDQSRSLNSATGHLLRPMLTARGRSPPPWPHPPLRSALLEPGSACPWVSHIIPSWWPIPWSLPCSAEWPIQGCWMENLMEILTR